jgi:hypothetical protein
MQQDSDLLVRLCASPCRKEGKSHRHPTRALVRTRHKVLTRCLSHSSSKSCNRRFPFLASEAAPSSLCFKNKVVEHGTFCAPQKMVFSHHVSPPIHHNLTIKKPRSAHHFSQKPLQKHPSPPQQIFLPLP